MENVKFLNYVGQMIFLSVANTNLLIAFQECQILISTLAPFNYLLQSRYLGNISLFRNARITHFFLTSTMNMQCIMLYRVIQSKKSLLVLTEYDQFQKWHFSFGPLVFCIQCTTTQQNWKNIFSLLQTRSYET